MGWAHGMDDDGREVGYAVEDVCNLPGCDVGIDRGLAYRCGGLTQMDGGPGCGGYFCAHHLFYLGDGGEAVCPGCAR